MIARERQEGCRTPKLNAKKLCKIKKNNLKFQTISERNDRDKELQIEIDNQKK